MRAALPRRPQSSGGSESRRAVLFALECRFPVLVIARFRVACSSARRSRCALAARTCDRVGPAVLSAYYAASVLSPCRRLCWPPFSLYNVLAYSHSQCPSDLCTVRGHQPGARRSRSRSRHTHTHTHTHTHMNHSHICVSNSSLITRLLPSMLIRHSSLLIILFNAGLERGTATVVFVFVVVLAIVPVHAFTYLFECSALVTFWRIALSELPPHSSFSTQ